MFKKRNDTKKELSPEFIKFLEELWERKPVSRMQDKRGNPK